jgi:hypothetical protein
MKSPMASEMGVDRLPLSINFSQRHHPSEGDSAMPKHTTTHRSRAKTVTSPETGPKRCFSDLRYRNGFVYATFSKDGSQYVYPASLSEAREWLRDASPGSYFNDNVRE